MRPSMIPLSLLAAALLASPAFGQQAALSGVNVQPQATHTLLPSPVVGQRVALGNVNVEPWTTAPTLSRAIVGNAFALRDLRIAHVSSIGNEVGIEPAGKVFTEVPDGPACTHWPGNGCGVKYSIARVGGPAYVYTGRELINLGPEEVGETGLHDNLIRVAARVPVSALVDVQIRSVVDAFFSYQVAEVDVMGFGTVRHEFRPGYAETVKTVPAQLDPAGLQIHSWTQLFVDNSSQPGRQALLDLEVRVTVRLPPASYTTGEATCVGSNGVPFLFPTGNDLPLVGDTFTVTVMNLPIFVSRVPNLPAFGLIGGVRMLPFDLGPFGMPSCYLHIASPVVVPLENCCGTAVWDLPIPARLELVGAEFVQQVFAMDESWVNPLGAVITNYGHGVIGAVPLPQ